MVNPDVRDDTHSGHHCSLLIERIQPPTKSRTSRCTTRSVNGYIPLEVPCIAVFDFKEAVKAFFTQKRRFYLKPDVFVWTVGSLEEFGHYRTIGEIC
jgi:hypothetical protein